MVVDVDDVKVATYLASICSAIATAPPRRV
jgi:hypothetical protein